jgi:hypothetical protein
LQKFSVLSGWTQGTASTTCAASSILMDCTAAPLKMQTDAARHLLDSAASKQIEKMGFFNWNYLFNKIFID